MPSFACYRACGQHPATPMPASASPEVLDTGVHRRRASVAARRPAPLKTSLDFEGEEKLGTTLILHLARANLSVMDHYIPAFVALTAGNKSPEEALCRGGDRVGH